MEGDILLKLCTVIQLIHRFKNILNFYYKKNDKNNFYGNTFGIYQDLNENFEMKKTIISINKIPQLKGKMIISFTISQSK